MDHKTWLWRKKSTEKDATEKAKKGNEEEVIVTEKEEREGDFKVLSDKLSSALSECNAKDDLVKKNAKIAQEAIAGWEKAETEAVSLKQELDKALQQRVALEERASHLDAALKECMQQLRFVREEQEQRIHDAVTRTSTEFQKTQMVLEEKLDEGRKRISKLGIENTHLSKALAEKEKLIEDLNVCRTQAETDFNALMTRLGSTEKGNTSLKYEVRVLEKELEIRNEEREFNRRTADASHKQHLESMKKIAKLESECQRLRLLVRKRLPGPAALAKMRNEVELLGKDPSEIRRRKLSSSPLGFTVDFVEDNSPDTPSKSINFMTEQLCTMEEENKTLKENFNKKTNELQFLRSMFARTASKLSQVEAKLEESSKGQTIMEPNRSSLISQELSVSSVSDIGSDDKVSCAESWASALISELEHFKNGKQKGPSSCKTVGVSEINLMDDFVEMEKLAIVSVDETSGSSEISSDKNNAIVGPLEGEFDGNSSRGVGREIVPVSDCTSLSVSEPETQSKDLEISKVPGWLQDVLKVVLEQFHLTQRNPDEILEDIRVALAHVNHSSPRRLIDAIEILNHPHGSNSLHGDGIFKGKPPVMDSSYRETDVDISPIEDSKQFQPNLNKSISKMIELIEGISLPSLEYNQDIMPGKDSSFLPYKISETSSGYMVRVFQWKTSELGVVLQEFVRTCYNLLNGKLNLENFAHELTSALEWIVNHCFSLQDVSSMRDAIKKQFDWESESEVESGMISQFSEAERLRVSKEQSCFPQSAALNGHNILFEMEDLQFDMKEDIMKLKDQLMNMELTKKDLEERLRAATDQSESSMFKLQESGKKTASLQTELENLKESKGMIEHQVENHRSMNEDLDRQLSVARAELNEARQKLSSLEVGLKNKNNSCEELEATCLELQLQLESLMKKDIPKNDMGKEEKSLRTDWEITAASEKLAECQETILNLGKQLKALASPREAALFDKVISTPADTNITTPTTTTPKNKNTNQRSSLLDQMLAEDDAAVMDLSSPKTKEIICTSNPQKSTALQDGDFKSAFAPNGLKELPEMLPIVNGIKHKGDEAAVGSLAIVPSKKQGGGGLLRKLLWRRKKGNSKKMALPLPA
ncbi:filament-like plant protein 7 [Malania oleifera]|uniref:filament-like plant protein 7 n=1 Tax=Malania oleifera TaxID=397392 RepID=UPI0025ADC381|nr:filament-like plant protein 7 [Malania oleifera]XP_057972582.1 filament-like plant protein 7 [Malania oleifera]